MPFDEKLTLAYGLGDFDLPIINSTGVIKLDDDFKILPGSISVSIPAFQGYIFNQETTISNPIDYKGNSNYTPQFLLTADATHVLIDVDSEITAQSTEPNDQQKEDFVYLCEIQHPQGIVTNIVQHYDSVTQGSNKLGNLVRFLDPMVRRCNITPNGNNLLLDINAGQIMINAVGDDQTYTSDIKAESPMSFQYTTQDSTYGAATTSVDPDNYDNAGVVTAVTPGNYTIQRMGLTFDKTKLIQYGRTQYANIEAAIVAFNDIETNFLIEDGMNKGAILGYILVQQGVTDLSDTSTGVIVPVDIFGEIKNPLADTIISTITTGTALLAANNLSDLTNASTARTNLGAGAANGLAQLNASSQVVAAQLPATIQPQGILQQIKVTNTAYEEVLYVPIVSTLYTGLANVNIVFYVEIGNRNLDYEVREELGPSVVTTGTITTTGHKQITFARPGGDIILKLALKKSAIDGDHPLLKGLLVSFIV